MGKSTKWRNRYSLYWTAPSCSPVPPPANSMPIGNALARPPEKPRDKLLELLLEVPDIKFPSTVHRTLKNQRWLLSWKCISEEGKKRTLKLTHSMIKSSFNRHGTNHMHESEKNVNVRRSRGVVAITKEWRRLTEISLEDALLWLWCAMLWWRNPSTLSLEFNVSRNKAHRKAPWKCPTKAPLASPPITESTQCSGSEARSSREISWAPKPNQERIHQYVEIDTLLIETSVNLMHNMTSKNGARYRFLILF
jgi:hypothetical protein